MSYNGQEDLRSSSVTDGVSATSDDGSSAPNSTHGHASVHSDHTHSQDTVTGTQPSVSNYSFLNETAPDVYSEEGYVNPSLIPLLGQLNSGGEAQGGNGCSTNNSQNVGTKPANLTFTNLDFMAPGLETYPEDAFGNYDFAAGGAQGHASNTAQALSFEGNLTQLPEVSPSQEVLEEFDQESPTLTTSQHDELAKLPASEDVQVVDKPQARDSSPQPNLERGISPLHNTHDSKPVSIKDSEPASSIDDETRSAGGRKNHVETVSPHKITFSATIEIKSKELDAFEKSLLINFLGKRSDFEPNQNHYGPESCSRKRQKA